MKKNLTTLFFLLMAALAYAVEIPVGYSKGIVASSSAYVVNGKSAVSAATIISPDLLYPYVGNEIRGIDSQIYSVMDDEIMMSDIAIPTSKDLPKLTSSSNKSIGIEISDWGGRSSQTSWMEESQIEKGNNRVSAANKEAYVILLDNKLTFYYDEYPGGHVGVKYSLYQFASNWEVDRATIKEVEFSPSFYEYHPESTGEWFANMKNLENIINIQYLNTSEDMYMVSMFYGCSSLKELDLSHFTIVDTYQYDSHWIVHPTENLLMNCTGLRTLSLPTYSPPLDSTACVGVGTPDSPCELIGPVLYNLDNYLDKSYFNMWGGCFHYKVPDSYAVLSNEVLTFYCDTRKEERQGVMFPLDIEDSSWSSFSDYIKTINYDYSFKIARPTNVKNWFKNLKQLISVEGIDNLIIKNDQDLSSLFSDCCNLTRIDGSQFDGFLSINNCRDVSSMFFNCRSLDHVSLRISGNNIKMDSLFYGCSNLDHVSLNVSGNDINMDSLFYGHSSLDHVSLGVSGNNITLDSLFYGCSNLDHVSLNVSGNNINLDSLFYGHSSLDHVSLSVSGNNINMKSLFYGCSNLKGAGIKVSGIVTDMSYMFYGCRNMIKSYDSFSFDVEGVTDMSYMFYGCSSLTDLDLSGICFEDIVNYTNMMIDCSSLVSLTLANSAHYLDDNAFRGVGSLENPCVLNILGKLDFKNFDWLNDCFTWKKGFFTLPIEDYTELYDNTLIFYSDKKRLFRDGECFIHNVRGDFNNCKWRNFSPTITKVSFDPSYANARPFTTANWFADMKNLTCIDGLEYLNTSGVGFMSSMFEGCEKLEHIDLSGFDTSSVMFMDNMFKGCIYLSDLDLSRFDTSNVMYRQYSYEEPDGYEGFLNNCSNLKTLRISATFNQIHSDIFNGVGTTDTPCLLYVPEGMRINNASEDCFNWFGGYFRLPNEKDLSIYAEASTVRNGVEGNLFIKFDPIIKVCNGYQFVLNLPAGITLAEDENSGEYFYSLGDRYSDKDKIQISIYEKAPGVYQLLCFSLTNETINIRDIPVITLKIVVPENLEDNIYEGKITDVACSFVDGSSLNADDTSFTIPVSRIKMGDANGDGSVNVTDVMLIVNHILGNTLPVFHEECANINGDSRIDVADVMLVVNMILSGEAQAPAVAQFETSGLKALSTSNNKVELRIDNMSQYTAFQMQVQMPADVRLLGVEMAEETTGHRIMTKEIGDGLYNVIVYSLNGENFKETSDGTLLRLVTSGKAKNLQIQNIQFTNPSFETITFSDATGTTGIEDVSSYETDGIYYNLQGMPVKNPTHGIFLQRGKKIIKK